MTHSAKEIQIGYHLTIYTFATILKWPRIFQNYIRKSFLGDILCFGQFFIKFTITAVKLYQHWK